ncbi:glycosyltransferase [Paenibacillus agilis]|uniref:Glycosyltransferase n=1 Tax=Paenibacillus agilis TaxID=3020863 RepID=A0A559IKX5_9BACL|nr:glycosyltransferase [Paenibacillus agilis]TVX88133.1 glycosyltransferase [Paenibacillus agilis]
MNRSTPPLIQQQMYTRERSGIFRSTEGYDTIARSNGLDPTFIKKTLHPFCMYDAPAQLSNVGEKDESQYPEAVHLIHTEGGQIVLGCSVYQSADFTGLRSAFFTHNYVIPAERSQELVTNYVSWLHATFARSYLLENGSELPELAELPTASAAEVQEEWNIESPAAMRSVLAKLRIDEAMFKQMLFAVMSAVANKKKVYIALDVPISQTSNIARKLLGILYASMPHAFRAQLGFLSYAKEPQSKKGIHVMFVEKGSLRQGDRTIEKDYTFDLATQRVTNVEADLAQQPYLDFAWRNLDRVERAASFYAYAELMLSDMGPTRSMSLASYHELAVLFQIEEGKHSLYEQNRIPVLQTLLDYLAPKGALQKKQQLNNLFVQLFQREYEAVKQRHIPEISVVERFKEYDQREDTFIREAFIGYLISALNHALAAQRTQEANALYALIERSNELSKPLFDKVLNGGFAGTLFMPFLHHKLQQTQTAEEAIRIVHDWTLRHNQLRSLPAYSEMAHYHLEDKLRHTPDLVKAVNDVLEQIHQLEHSQQVSTASSKQSTAHQQDHDGSTPLLLQLLYAANQFLLTELDLDHVTKQQLLQVGFLEEAAEFRAWVTRFDQRIRAKAAVMLAAYQWFSTTKPDATIFDNLSPSELDRVQKLGQRWLQQDLQSGQFDKLVLAFCQDTDEGVLEYGTMLQFIHTYAKDRETLYQFFNWSETHPSFIRARKLHPNYAAAMVTYFKRHDRDAFKSRQYRKQYFEQAGPALEPVYEKARYELSSPLARLFSKRKNVVLFSVGTAVVVIGTAAGLYASGVFGTKDVPTAVTDPTLVSPPEGTATDPSGTGSTPDSAGTDPNAGNPSSTTDPANTTEQSAIPGLSAVYAEQVKQSPADVEAENDTGNGNGADTDSDSSTTINNDTTQLVFEFESAEPCKVLAQSKPASASLLPANEQNQAQSFSITAPIASCDTAPYQVKLPLAEKLELQAGARIQIGEQTYTLSEPKQPSVE